MFRELQTLATVYKVDWLRENCFSWLRGKIQLAVTEEEKVFLFDECWYILDQWGDWRMMNVLISAFAPQDNTVFLYNYVGNFDSLETGQIDILLKLGGSDTELFLNAILQNLTDRPKLTEKLQYLLQKMNLPLCNERSEELFLTVFETISNFSEISISDLRFELKLMSETTRLVSTRRNGKIKTTYVYDRKSFQDQLRRCKSLDDIISSISEDRTSSMFVVVEQLLYVYYKNTPNIKDTTTFAALLEKIFSEKKLQKISQSHLDTVIAALIDSTLAQSYQIITLLDEIKKSKKLSTCYENVTIKRNEFLTVKKDNEHKRLYNFKHPGLGTCTEPGKCGFILKSSKQDSYWTEELCTNSEDYTGTGLHFHDIVSAHDMFRYVIRSGNTAAGNKVTVAGRWQWEKKWLPEITDWKMQPSCIAYNVSDYLVVKQE
jgi:hypothetical protein